MLQNKTSDRLLSRARLQKCFMSLFWLDFCALLAGIFHQAVTATEQIKPTHLQCLVLSVLSLFPNNKWQSIINLGIPINSNVCLLIYLLLQEDVLWHSFPRYTEHHVVLDDLSSILPEIYRSKQIVWKNQPTQASISRPDPWLGIFLAQISVYRQSVLEQQV